MLTPIGQPLPHDLQGRGYHILETLEGLGMGQQLNLACRTLLAMLLLRRPSAGAPKAQRDAFTTLWMEVPVRLREANAEIKRGPRIPKAPPRKGTLRPKVGDA